MDFERIIDLVDRTKRSLVLGRDFGEPVVIMPLIEYEILTDVLHEYELDRLEDDELNNESFVEFDDYLPSEIPFEPINESEGEIFFDLPPLEEQWYIEPVE